MERKIEKRLREWKNKPRKKPLLMLGCRQVGKTYSIREFLKANYDSYIEVNLEKQPESRQIFKGSLDSKVIIDKLIISNEVEMVPGRSAIFLDEVQASPGAYSSLKWLKEDGRFDIIASGSFLGLTLHDEDDPVDTDHVPISPLGYVDSMEMYPMDFEEYLWAMNVDRRIIQHAKDAIQSRTPVDEYYDAILREHFLRYLIVGGMPDAVEMYAQTRDYVQTKEVLKSILDLLKTDAGKYSKRMVDKMRILACMESIPAQLASDKRRFEYQDIEKSTGGSRRYGDALGWLVMAGMSYTCTNLRSVDPPLSLNMKPTMFKIYMCDTGLLMTLMKDPNPGAIVNLDPFSNNGSIMENAVAAALVKKGYPLYYYAKENSTLEIDFVIQNGPVQLIEVKSGRNKRSKSLNTLLAEKHRNREGLKICDGKVEVDGNGAIHLPLYGACFIPDFEIIDIPPVEAVLGGLKNRASGDHEEP